MTTQDDNPFLRLMEGSDEGRRSLFGGLFSGYNPSQQNFAQQSIFQPTFNRYLGQLGQQVRGGGAPTLTFKDFLQQSFNPQRELLKMQDDRSRLFGGRTIFDFGR